MSALAVVSNACYVADRSRFIFSLSVRLETAESPSVNVFVSVRLPALLVSRFLTILDSSGLLSAIGRGSRSWRLSELWVWLMCDGCARSELQE